MIELFKRDLGEQGIKYVTSRLQKGGSLSKAFFQLKGPIRNVFSPLPKEINEAQALHFDEALNRQVSAIKWFASYVSQQMSKQLGWSFLIEDSWAKPEDSAIYDRKHKVFVFEKSVLYGLEGQEFGEEEVKRLLRSVSSFSYSGFISSVELPKSKKIPLQLNDDFVEAFAKKISLAVISAYDHEGILISEINPQ